MQNIFISSFGPITISPISKILDLSGVRVGIQNVNVSGVVEIKIPYKPYDIN